jgi:epoxyqueuosine reductase
MSASLESRLKAECLRSGFDAVGIASAVAPGTYPSYREWLARGDAASMHYLERQADARAHPVAVLEGVRSVIMGAFVYGSGSTGVGTAPTSSPPTVRGKIGRYAQGADYHNILWRRLESIGEWLQSERPGARTRAVADTAPLLERDFARLSGLGWFGKNTMLIHKKLGSFTVLGALLTDLDLVPDEPFAADCGTCTRCLDACPTGALPEPYRLDSNRCISYWTIEHRGPIPEPWAGKLHGWVFGCDICQEVCPWNRKAQEASDAELRPRQDFVDPDLLGWLERPEDELRALIRGTALRRAKPAGLRRNAALILGENASPEAEARLIDLLEHDPDAGVRAAAAWSLAKLGTETGCQALEFARNDPDPAVRQAVHRAFDSLARHVKTDGANSSS